MPPARMIFMGAAILDKYFGKRRHLVYTVPELIWGIRNGVVTSKGGIRRFREKINTHKHITDFRKPLNLDTRGIVMIGV